jgi:uncharacterized coiled-coil DUF342 family protein
VEAAEKAVQVAIKNVSQAKAAHDAAKDALHDYTQRLSSLIDELYEQCVGQAVGKDLVQEIHQKELKLLAKRDEYRNDCHKCEEHVKECETALVQAKATLREQELKYEGLKSLITQENKQYKIALERKENKQMDEFASNKHITNNSRL